VETLAALLPALFAAAHLAGLLFFLNHEYPFGAAGLVRAAGYYTLLLAPLALGAHFAIVRWRAVAGARLLPWSLTLVAAIVAVADGAHASHYAFYLPESINAQLIKSGLWTALGAVLLFYTALLHTLHHRPYGPRSRLLVALVVVGSVVAMHERRASYRPASEPPTRSAAIDGEPRPIRSFVLVAIPTATLDALLPLARQGKLPFVAQMLEGGGAARLALPPPPRAAALWASWATGKLPFRHGIVGDVLYSAPLLGPGARLALLPLAPGFARWGLAGGEPEPLAATDRRARVLWEILEQLEQSVARLGWPSWLAEEDALPALRRSGVPIGLAARELEGMGRGGFALRLRDDEARLAAARELAASANAPDALFVRLDGLEGVALETYGGFSAVIFEATRSAASTGAARAYETYLAGLDAALALLWEELPPPRLLALSSPYGVAAPAGLARFAKAVASSDLELRGSLAGAPEGLLLLRGDGIRAGVQIADAASVDLVPTLLYAGGWPLARDLDGRALTELFEPAVLQQRALYFVPTFEGLRRAPR
jgi:hypothetical protein